MFEFKWKKGKFKGWMLNFKTGINFKIISTFIAVIIIMGSISFYPLVSYQQPINKYNAILNNVILADTVINESKELFDNTSELYLELYVGVKNKDFREKNVALIKQLNDTFASLEQGLLSENSKRKLSKLKPLIATFIENVSNSVNENDIEDIVKRSKYFNEVRKTPDIIDINFKELISYEIEYSKEVSVELSKTTRNILISTVSILICVLVICLFIGFIIARKISEPVKNISQAADKVASGDLTSKDIIVNSRDELKQLGDSFNKMITNLKDIVSKVGESSGQVLNVSDQLNQSSNQSSMASEHIAQSIQEVADGAAIQAKLLEEAALTINGMYNIIKNILSKSTLAKETSTIANKVTQEGNQLVNKAISHISNLNTTITESSHISEELFKKSKEIGTIVDVITSIANQTNLLALNAAIEAARAGVQGRGFAVVADEVKKLAEQSSSAASKIIHIIKDVQNETTKMSKSMNKSIDQIYTGIEVTNTTGKAFEKISTSISEVNGQVNDIYIEILNMNTAIQEIKGTSDNVAKISKTSAGSSQEVASAIEELSSGMEEINSTANVLNNMATELQELVNTFKIQNIKAITKTSNE